MLNSAARFSSLPKVDLRRSIFNRSHTHLTTANAGQLFPIYVDDILPGDTVTMDLAMISRMSTPIFPVMDDAYIDIHFFFVPLRLVWENSKYFFGEQKEAWYDGVEYQIPQIEVGSDGYRVFEGGLLDHLGIPLGYEGSLSALYVRAYSLIWNEWYRDQNLIDPILVNKGDTDYLGAYDFGNLRKVAKYHDYFTSCLPSPQRGDPVALPLGDLAPVLTNASKHDFSTAPIYMAGFSDVAPDGNGSLVRPLNITAGENGDSGTVGFDKDYTTLQQPDAFPFPTNFWADLSKATAATVNDLRQAFAVQRLLEKDARGGSRYRELVANHFGVSTGDARVQVPEYLGGRHIPVQVSQVVQMSATNTADGTTPQGNTAAFSKTNDVSSIFTKSFTEHGILMGLACVRTKHTYQQGLNRMFSRKDRLDFYWPSLAYIGEQAVLNKEIYALGSDPDEVFGYQEAWADYRYKPNTVSGAFRSDSSQPLDAWHYADDYDATPRLSPAWIQETSANVDRTLAVSSKVADQFIFQFAFRERWARPMPLDSIPGMRDYF